MTAGFIGLGNIGYPMARRLAEGRNGSWVYDIVPEARMALADCAQIASSPVELARHCNQIGICVRNDDDVENVLTGEDGLLAGLAHKSGAVIAVHSTISLDNLHRFADMALQAGAELVDAAVTGGAEVAARGQLTAMLGGEADIAKRLADLVGTYASTIIHAGPLGAGMKLKVANNLVTYTQLAVGVEAVRLAALADVDPARLLEVMRLNGNLTPAMDAYLGARAQAIAAGGGEEFAAFQSGLAGLAEKDLDHAIATAAGVDAPTLMGAHTRQVFREIVERIDT